MIQSPIRIKVLYFTQIADAAGTREESYSLPSNASVAELLGRISTAHKKIEKTKPMMEIAVNEDMAKPDQVLKDGDTVALFSPISGG